jgi:serine/threonine protein kinase
MKHPTSDVLQAFGLGKVSGPAANTIAAHLTTCIDCRRVVADLSADSFVGRLQAADAGSVPPASMRTADVPPELANHADYRVVRELGRGGMGVVYLVRNVLMDREEVLKIGHRDLLDKPGAADRFLQEIRSAARLMHANVVRAFSVVRLGELLGFAMEYVPGDDLAKIVRKQGALGVAHACHYVAQAAQGLQHAHEKGMVHRDIKPSNLILSRDGKKPVVKILDFGLAKMTSEAGFGRDLTGSNKMMGTPDYISPEQILDAAKADIRADIYSLGCTLHYLLSGSPPFAGGSLYEVLHAHSTETARPLNLVRPEVPAELAAVVAKMLAKEPRKRYQTPGEVAKELQPFTTAGAVPTPAAVMPTAHPAPAPPKARHMTRGPVDARKLSRSVDEKDSAPFEFAAKTMLESPPNRARSRKRAAGKDRRAVWIGLGLAVMLGVVGLLGLLLAASGTFRVTTPDGTIVLDDLPEGAEVRVDGNRIALQNAGNSVEIRTVPGKHKLEIRQVGFRMFGREVEVDLGSKVPVQVRLEPIAPPPQGVAVAAAPKIAVPTPPPPVVPNRELEPDAAVPKVGVAAPPQVVSNPSPKAGELFVTYKGVNGPGKGKKIVLGSGEEEYRSEELLPQFAKILAVRHGFDCSVLFAIDPKTGAIDPGEADNIPGLATLDSADLLILFTRFRNLPDEQMKHFADYFESGKPIIGLRTATHAFANIPKTSPYAKYNWSNGDPAYRSGFGRQILGETWVSHQGNHGSQSTLGILNKNKLKHPILRGLKDGDIWGSTDVYGVHLPDDCVPLVYGEVLSGMKKTDPPVRGRQNEPMMPIAWTKPHLVNGRNGRTFTCTTADGQDFLNEGVRRLLVNATFWAIGMDDRIEPTLNIALIGDYNPPPFRSDGHRKGVRPADLEMR